MELMIKVLFMLYTDEHLRFIKMFVLYSTRMHYIEQKWTVNTFTFT